MRSNDLRSLYADLSTDPSENLSLRLNMGNMDENSFRDGVSGNRKLFAPSMSWQLTPDLNWLVQYEYSRYNRTPDRGIVCQQMNNVSTFICRRAMPPATRRSPPRRSEIAPQAQPHRTDRDEIVPARHAIRAR